MGVEVSTYCDYCRNGCCGQDLMCESCVGELKDQVEDLERDLENVKEERDDLVEEIKRLQNEIEVLKNG